MKGEKLMKKKVETKVPKPKAKKEVVVEQITIVENGEMSQSAKSELDRLEKLSKDVFIESEDNPDDFKNYPKIVVCTLDPQKYAYPMLLKMENSNIVRIEVMNNYVSTVLRLIDLFRWCMDIRLKRKRVSIQMSTGKKIVVNEFILEKIPACRL
jgi:hypothetical protein